MRSFAASKKGYDDSSRHRGTILEKAEYVEGAITILAEKQSLTRETYRDSREQQAIVEREFQTAIEACIDIAGLLLRALDVTMPDTYAQRFPLLAELDVLSPETSDRMRKAAGFRNIPVHQYGDAIYCRTEIQIDIRPSGGRHSFAVFCPAVYAGNGFPSHRTSALRCHRAHGPTAREMVADISTITTRLLVDVAQNQTVSEMTKQDITICIDAYPDADVDVFRIGAADEILRLLVDAHETEFTISDLVDATGVTRSTVWRAVNLLDSVGVVQIRETPQRNHISVNPDRLSKDDPVLAIEQPEFHAPVRAFLKHVHEAVRDAAEINDVLGIVIFGSVARGEADRTSDIDVFVAVDGNRTSARRVVSDVVAELREQRFNGDRFEFEPYVESADSARRAGSKLRDIFTEGITVSDTHRFQSLRKEVIADE